MAWQTRQQPKANGAPNPAAASHEAIVYYWSNAGFARHVAGHLALKLHGPGYSGGGKPNSAFVNWAPRSGAGRNVFGPLRKTDALGLGYKAVHNAGRFTYRADKVAMESAADVKVFLPAKQATGQYGLDTDFMFEWWRVFSRAESTGWGMAFRNCSSVVAKCMLAGGAATYAAPPSLPLWTPDSVAKWAAAVRARIEELNRKTILATSSLRAQSSPFGLNVDGAKRLFTVAEFRAVTNSGALHVRDKTLTNVDAALARLAAYPTWTTRESQLGLIDVALDVCAAVHERLAAKPTSQHTANTVLLGRQMLTLIDDANRRIAELEQRAYMEEIGEKLRYGAHHLGPWDFLRLGRAPDHDERADNDLTYGWYAHLTSAHPNKKVPYSCAECAFFEQNLEIFDGVKERIMSQLKYVYGN